MLYSTMYYAYSYSDVHMCYDVFTVLYRYIKIVENKKL